MRCGAVHTADTRVAALPVRLLHLLTRIALRIQPPLEAKGTVERAAAFVPSIADVDAAVRLAERLDGRGTCLSRAFTISACLPDSEVVIAVGPGGMTPLFAHAWVEHRGRPLRQTDVAGREIVRLGKGGAAANNDSSRLVLEAVAYERGVLP